MLGPTKDDTLLLIHVPWLLIGRRASVIVALGRALQEHLVRDTHKTRNISLVGRAIGQRLIFKTIGLCMYSNLCKVGKQEGLFG